MLILFSMNHVLFRIMDGWLYGHFILCWSWSTLWYRYLCLRGSDSMGWVTVLMVTSDRERVMRLIFIQLSQGSSPCDTWDPVRFSTRHCEHSLCSTILLSLYTDMKIGIPVIMPVKAHALDRGRKLMFTHKPAFLECVPTDSSLQRSIRLEHWGSIYPLLLVICIVLGYHRE